MLEVTGDKYMCLTFCVLLFGIKRKKLMARMHGVESFKN
jgi:hypothetical protein